MLKCPFCQSEKVYIAWCGDDETSTFLTCRDCSGEFADRDVLRIKDLDEYDEGMIFDFRDNELVVMSYAESGYVKIYSSLKYKDIDRLRELIKKYEY